MQTITVAHSSRRERTIAIITSAGTYRMDGLKCAGVKISSRTVPAEITTASAIARTGDTREEIRSMTMLYLDGMGSPGPPGTHMLFLASRVKSPVAPVNARPEGGEMAGGQRPLGLAPYQHSSRAQ